MPHSLAHIVLIVRDYDEAIAWFTTTLRFTLVADEYQPSRTSAGCSSRRRSRARTPHP
jgi:catechol 2,3-dioxygenase-like lactoylglutathione lyase family enzyme